MKSMRLFFCSAVLGPALAFSVSCSNGGSDGESSNKPPVKKLDAAQFPNVQGTIMGGWVFRNPQHDKGVTFTLRTFFNQNNEVGFAMECSDGFRSAVASGVVKGRITGTTVETLESLDVSESNGDFKCSFNSGTATVNYKVVGDTLQMTDNQSPEVHEADRIR